MARPAPAPAAAREAPPVKMGAAGVVAEPVGLTPGVDDRGVEEGGRMGYLMGVLLGLGVAVLELYLLLVVIYIWGDGIYDIPLVAVGDGGGDHGAGDGVGEAVARGDFLIL